MIGGKRLTQEERQLVDAALETCTLGLILAAREVIQRDDETEYCTCLAEQTPGAHQGKPIWLCDSCGKPVREDTK